MHTDLVTFFNVVLGGIAACFVVVLGFAGLLYYISSKKNPLEENEENKDA